MNTLRVIITLVLVTLLAVLSVFQMQIRGYEKLSRINPQAVLYRNDEECNQIQQLIYEDNNYEYYVTCSDDYIIKSGFQEKALNNALNLEIVTMNELQEVLDIEIVEKE